MIKQQLLFLFIATTLFSCGLIPGRSGSDISGMYVRTIHQRYATGSDTLVLTALSGGVYQVIKRSGYQRIKDGKKGDYEYDVQHWTGVYDEKEGMIRESRKGKVLVPLPKENKLLLGSAMYEKVE